MEELSVIGLDLAKSVFQVHGSDSRGRVLFRKKLARRSVVDFFRSLAPCVVGMEACSSAHHWGRMLRSLGHDVRLIAPSYVKAYVKRGKTDAADAEAIAEAVSRPTMRFVPLKSEEEQAALIRHKVRTLLIKQRTMLVNALRGHLAEFGLVDARRRQGLTRLKEAFCATPASVPADAHDALQAIIVQIDQLDTRIIVLEKEIVARCRASAVCCRLMGIEGVGPISAHLIAGSVPDARVFARSRDFAAWLGLTPKSHSTGGKERLGRISKKGNEEIRRLLVQGAAALLMHANRAKTPRPSRLLDWVRRLIGQNKPFKLVAVALANKLARIVWAVMSRNEPYKAQPAHA